MSDSVYKQAPPARTIAMVTLPEAALAFIQGGNVTDGLSPDLFGVQGAAMSEVAGFVAQLSPSQKELLLVGLQHALEAHGATVHFAEQQAGYELLGTGVEIKDDSAEGSTGPVGVFFATWNP